MSQPLPKTRVIYIGQSHTLIEWLCLKSDVELLAIFVPRDHYERSAWVSLCVHYQVRLYWSDDSREIENYLSHWKSNIDLGICAYFKKLSSTVIAKARLGFINIHPGILPNYPGRLPSMEAIYAGEREAGVSLHWMSNRLDQGDLIDIRYFPVLYQDTPAELEQRALQQAIHCLQEHWNAICSGRCARFPQTQSAIHKSPRWRLSPQDGTSLKEVWQIVKAYQPFGGVPFLVESSLEINLDDDNIYVLCMMHATIDYEPLATANQALNPQQTIALKYPYVIQRSHVTNTESMITKFIPSQRSSSTTPYVVSHLEGWQLIFYYKILQCKPLDQTFEVTDISHLYSLPKVSKLYPIPIQLAQVFPL